MLSSGFRSSLTKSHAVFARFLRTTGAPSTTVLPNNLRVVTAPVDTDFCSAGILIAAGSRSETPSNQGVSNLYKHAAFKQTSKRSALNLVRNIEPISPNFSVTVSREHVLLSGEVVKNNFSALITLLNEIVTSPVFDEWEVLQALNNLESQQTPSVNEQIVDLSHQQSFLTGLGNPLYFTSASKLHHLADTSVLQNYVKKHFRPENIAVIGLGVDHKELVDTVSKGFETLSPGTKSTEKSSSTFHSGGTAFLRGADKQHVVVSLPGSAISDKSWRALTVLQKVFGEADRHATPGHSGSSSRLGKALLESNKDVSFASAFKFSYSDAGLFGVYVVGEGKVDTLVQQIHSSLKSIAKTPVTQEELDRAKKQAVLDFLYRSEDRRTLLEFLGSQALYLQNAKSPESIASELEKVTLDEVNASLTKLQDAGTNVVVLGDF